MPIYTQYLTTFANPGWNNGTPINNTSLNAVRWNLNFDEILGYENHKYKYCRLRIKLQMTSWSGVSTDWETYLGYLACNLPASGGARSTYGTLLSPTYVMHVPTEKANSHAMLIDTTGEGGVDIIVPKGNQDFVLTFSPMDLTKSRTANIYDYQVVLYFELYDKIDGM